jgi:Carboxypeptidase regulatory-like domain
MATATTRRFLLMLVLTVLLVLGLTTTALAGPSDTTVNGVVKGHGWHFTVSLVGAKVTVVGSSPLQQATTVAQGAYSLLATISVPPYYYGGANIRATATSYIGHTAQVTANPGSTRTRNYSLLVKATRLSGRVLNHAGHPIASVTVTVAGRTGHTNGNGFFRLTQLRLKPGKSYAAKIAKPGYQTRHVRFESAPGGSRMIVVSLHHA